MHKPKIFWPSFVESLILKEMLYQMGSVYEALESAADDLERSVKYGARQRAAAEILRTEVPPVPIAAGRDVRALVRETAVASRLPTNPFQNMENHYGFAAPNLAYARECCCLSSLGPGPNKSSRKLFLHDFCSVHGPILSIDASYAPEHRSCQVDKALEAIQLEREYAERMAQVLEWAAIEGAGEGCCTQRKPGASDVSNNASRGRMSHARRLQPACPGPKPGHIHSSANLLAPHGSTKIPWREQY